MNSLYLLVMEILEFTKQDVKGLLTVVLWMFFALLLSRQLAKIRLFTITHKTVVDQGDCSNVAMDQAALTHDTQEAGGGDDDAAA
jgi:hypothetical protein